MLNINSADLAKIESPSNDFSPLPDGKYCAVLESAVDEAKTSKAGVNYSVVNVQYRLVGGEHNNRRVFRGYIYQHETSEIAGDIGIQGLKQLFTALECSGDLTVATLEGSDKCVQIVLKTKPSKNPQYQDRQEVVFVGPCVNCPAEGCSTPAADVDADDDIF